MIRIRDEQLLANISPHAGLPQLLDVLLLFRVFRLQFSPELLQARQQLVIRFEKAVNGLQQLIASSTGLLFQICNLVSKRLAQLFYLLRSEHDIAKSVPVDVPV